MIKLDKEIIPYLKGEKFSNGLEMKITHKFEGNRRVDVIRDLCIGKRVIHIGCVDHIPLIEEKIASDIWLHKIISDVADEVVGVDINADGIKYLKEDLGFDNVICADITSDSITEINSKKWDYMILGEIIEHVNDPIGFLNDIRLKYEGVVDRIYITAPNVMVLNRYKSMVNRCSEAINTDHRFWFTPYTISKVLTLSGYNDIYLDFVDLSLLPKKDGLYRRLNTLINRKLSYPFYYFNSVVGVASFK